MQDLVFDVMVSKILTKGATKEKGFFPATFNKQVKGGGDTKEMELNGTNSFRIFSSYSHEERLRIVYF